MLIKLRESKKDAVTTKLIAVGHIYADYDEDDGDNPEYEFSEFDYEKYNENVVSQINDWELEVNNNTDVAKFEDLWVDDAYFKDSSDAESGVIEVYAEISTSKPLSAKDCQYIAENMIEFMVQDASINVGGRWHGEQEYWDGHSDYPSYRDASGDINEKCYAKLITKTPVTYKLL